VGDKSRAAQSESTEGRVSIALRGHSVVSPGDVDSPAGSRPPVGRHVWLGLDAALVSKSAASIMDVAPTPWGRGMFAFTMRAVADRHRYELERLSLKGWLVRCSCGWRSGADTKAAGREQAHRHLRLVKFQGLLPGANSRVFGSPHHVDRANDRVSCRCGWAMIGGGELERIEEALAHLLSIDWSEEARASAMRPASREKVVSRSARRLRASQAKAASKTA